MEKRHVDNVILLILCLALGVLLRMWGRMPEGSHQALNAFIINISLPSLTLHLIHGLEFNRPLLLAGFMPWIVFGASAVVFAFAGSMLGLNRKTTGALIIAGGLGNTSFIGIPMIEAFYGPALVPVGILADQLGTYLVLSTLGIVLICIYTQASVSSSEMLRRVITFPPLIAMAVALATLPVTYPSWVTLVLGRLSATLAPLALVSVGLQLRFSGLAGQKLPLAMGLGFKLIAAPALISALYAAAFRLQDDIAPVITFEAGMAPQIGASIVAMQYGLNAQLITLMVGLGTLLSFVTLPVLYYLMN